MALERRLEKLEKELKLQRANYKLLHTMYTKLVDRTESLEHNQDGVRLPKITRSPRNIQHPRASPKNDMKSSDIVLPPTRIPNPNPNSRSPRMYHPSPRSAQSPSHSSPHHARSPRQRIIESTKSPKKGISHKEQKRDKRSGQLSPGREVRDRTIGNERTPRQDRAVPSSPSTNKPKSDQTVNSRRQRTSSRSLSPTRSRTDRTTSSDRNPSSSSSSSHLSHLPLSSRSPRDRRHQQIRDKSESPSSRDRIDTSRSERQKSRSRSPRKRNTNQKSPDQKKTSARIKSDKNSTADLESESKACLTAIDIVLGRLNKADVKNLASYDGRSAGTTLLLRGLAILLLDDHPKGILRMSRYQLERKLHIKNPVKLLDIMKNYTVKRIPPPRVLLVESRILSSEEVDVTNVAATNAAAGNLSEYLFQVVKYRQMLAQSNGISLESEAEKFRRHQAKLSPRNVKGTSPVSSKRRSPRRQGEAPQGRQSNRQENNEKSDEKKSDSSDKKASPTNRTSRRRKERKSPKERIGEQRIRTPDKSAKSKQKDIFVTDQYARSNSTRRSSQDEGNALSPRRSRNSEADSNKRNRVKKTSSGVTKTRRSSLEGKVVLRPKRAEAEASEGKNPKNVEGSTSGDKQDERTLDPSAGAATENGHPDEGNKQSETEFDNRFEAGVPSTDTDSVSTQCTFEVFTDGGTCYHGSFDLQPIALSNKLHDRDSHFLYQNSNLRLEGPAWDDTADSQFVEAYRVSHADLSCDDYPDDPHPHVLVGPIALFLNEKDRWTNIMHQELTKKGIKVDITRCQFQFQIQGAKVKNTGSLQNEDNKVATRAPYSSTASPESSTSLRTSPRGLRRHRRLRGRSQPSSPRDTDKLASNDDTSPQGESDSSPEKKHYYVGKRKVFYYQSQADYQATLARSKQSPNKRLELDHVYGFNGSKCRNNLFYSHDGNKAIFNIASSIVIHDMRTGSEDIIAKHTSDITALAMHPTESVIASGQSGSRTGKDRKPWIGIFNYYTLEELARITYHDRFIDGLTFSASGDRLLAVGGDDNHIMAVFDWAEHDEVTEARKLEQKRRNEPSRREREEKHLKQFETEPDYPTRPSGKSNFFAAVTNRFLGEAGGLADEFLTIARKAVTLWKFIVPVSVGQKTNPKTVEWQSRKLKTYSMTGFLEKAFLTAAFLDKDLIVVGGASGYIYVFKASRLILFFQAHTGGVGSIVAIDQGSKCISAGFDGRLCQYSREQLLAAADNLPATREAKSDTDESSPRVKPLKQWNLGSWELAHPLLKNRSAFKAKALSYNANETKLLYGTKNHAIMEIDLSLSENENDQNDDIAPVGPLTRSITIGHDSMISAVAVHPETKTCHFVSGARNANVMAYNYGDPERPALKEKFYKAPAPVTCLSFSADGKYLCVGCDDSKVSLLDYASFEEVQLLLLGGSKQSIACCAFSPTDDVLAVGTKQSITLLSFPNLKVLDVVEGLTANVLSVSWSNDGRYLTGESQDLERLIWQVRDPQGAFQIQRCNSLAPFDNLDTWHSFTGRVGYGMNGIFGVGDATDVNTVHRSYGDKDRFVISGDDFGNVNLFNSPVVAGDDDASYWSCRGHSSFVTCVRFCPDNRYAFSAGGDDRAVLQWKLVENSNGQ